MRLIALIILVLIVVLTIASFYPSAERAAETATTTFYMCDNGKSITAAYYAGNTVVVPREGEPPVPQGRVALTLSDGRTFSLPRTLSADGLRYASPDESFVFWSKGSTAFTLEGDEQSYRGCISTAPYSIELPEVYATSIGGFSLRYPSDFAVDESYQYQGEGPEKAIAGTKFTIPIWATTGTNLSADTYISVERIPRVAECHAGLFLSRAAPYDVLDGEVSYSVASSVGAAAGNRYEETVYALPDTNPCIAVRYLIHYGVIENYPPGTVRPFDLESLVSRFDSIRRTLIVAQ